MTACHCRHGLHIRTQWTLLLLQDTSLYVTAGHRAHCVSPRCVLTCHEDTVHYKLLPACHTPLPPSDSFCTPLLPAFHYLGPGILTISCWTQWNVFGQVPPPHSNLCGVAPNSCWVAGIPVTRGGWTPVFTRHPTNKPYRPSENMLKLRDLQPTNLNTKKRTEKSFLFVPKLDQLLILLSPLDT